ncbi:MAG: hypothetical protein GF346_05860 [Candidatus Eisenbacteria bacterium]|nr:hypothetical protein [Candidatus Latescibacterota bacterium]MBD3301954.1 hypothetical protein [Candidatus Eisenbacteria bacterium]
MESRMSTNRARPDQRSAVPTALLAVAILLVGSSPSAAMFAGFEPLDDASAAPPAAVEEPAPERIVQAYPIRNGETVRVDGKLDESIWAAAEPAGGFLCWDPDRGAPASEETTFKVAYDADAIYFAVACHEEKPSRITKKLSRRDRFSDSDLVSVYIDPYFDRTTGYNFRVNPLGVQEDRYVYDDGQMDTDWDAVWEAETHEDPDGWYAEMRIPFSSIRYRAGQRTWGLQVYRYMHGRGEDTAWVTWERETAGFVSRFGRLDGIENIPAPRQLEILPYAVYRATDPATVGDDELDGFQNFGADLKYGVTADLTLNATIQPDFGQVEADPAVLNLSPFETFYQEKRPFFIEGSRFFQHPEFDLFYSRRIGTGDENRRIRYAAKLTGKTAGDISIGALAAATDVTEDGKTHNFLKEGSQGSRYFVGRVGKELREGKISFHAMQTAVVNDGSRSEHGDRASREAYTTGADFKLQLHDRGYVVQGSFVGSAVDSEPIGSGPDPATKYGTGGELNFQRTAGSWRGSVSGRWESEELDINDLGFLSAPDEMSSGAWIGYRYTPDGQSTWANRANLNFNFNKSWIYAGRTGFDLHTDEPVWSYDRGHRQYASGNVNGWTQLRGFQELWFGVNYNDEGSHRHETRSTVRLEDGGRAAIPGGGPLISEPTTYGGWFGGLTDSRKDLVFRLEGNLWLDTADNRAVSGEIAADWNQSSAVRHEIEIGYSDRTDDTQHLGNFENAGGGIGGVSYVFGGIHQRTLDLTLRTSLLFSRDQSLEIYAQPFLTVGDYENAKELARPDSYDFRPYDRDGFRAADHDFRYGAVNLNAVYRWEYRPGSTFYLVWTHSRSSYDERRFFDDPGRFGNDLDGAGLFDNEPENVLLAKLSYWFSI